MAGQASLTRTSGWVPTGAPIALNALRRARIEWPAEQPRGALNIARQARLADAPGLTAAHAPIGVNTLGRVAAATAGGRNAHGAGSQIIGELLTIWDRIAAGVDHHRGA
jgi:hypothetical protein